MVGTPLVYEWASKINYKLCVIGEMFQNLFYFRVWCWMKRNCKIFITHVYVVCYWEELYIFCNKIIFVHHHTWISCLKRNMNFALWQSLKNVIMCCFTILLHFEYSTCISHSSCFDLPNILNINDEYE